MTEDIQVLGQSCRQHAGQSLSVGGSVATRGDPAGGQRRIIVINTQHGSPAIGICPLAVICVCSLMAT